MGKRAAEKQLIKDDAERDSGGEDEPTPSSGSQFADDRTLAGRKIRGLPKRFGARATPPGVGPSPSQPMGGNAPPLPAFARQSAASATPLPVPSTAPQSTATTNTPFQNPSTSQLPAGLREMPPVQFQLDYLRWMKSLNLSLKQLILETLDKDMFFNFTPLLHAIASDYAKKREQAVDRWCGETPVASEAGAGRKVHFLESNAPFAKAVDGQIKPGTSSTTTAGTTTSVSFSNPPSTTAAGTASPFTFPPSSTSSSSPSTSALKPSFFTPASAPLTFAPKSALTSAPTSTTAASSAPSWSLFGSSASSAASRPQENSAEAEGKPDASPKKLNISFGVSSSSQPFVPTLSAKADDKSGSTGTDRAETEAATNPDSSKPATGKESVATTSAPSTSAPATTGASGSAFASIPAPKASPFSFGSSPQKETSAGSSSTSFPPSTPSPGSKLTPGFTFGAASGTPLAFKSPTFSFGGSFGSTSSTTSSPTGVGEKMADTTGVASPGMFKFGAQPIKFGETAGSTAPAAEKKVEDGAQSSEEPSSSGRTGDRAQQEQVTNTLADPDAPANSKGQYQTGEGEEGEEQVHEVRCKVWRLSEDKQFKEMGIGILRVKKASGDKGKKRRRILVRGDPSGLVMMNFNLYSDFSATLMPKGFLTFLGFDETGKGVHFRVKVKTESAAQKLKEVMEKEAKEVA